MYSNMKAKNASSNTRTCNIREVNKEELSHGKFLPILQTVIFSRQLYQPHSGRKNKV